MTSPSISESNQNNTVGFTFKITNPQNGVESTLIGTAHMANAETMGKLNVQQIIEKSSALYSEAGTNVFVTSAEGSRPEGDHEYTNITHRFCPDKAITLEAWAKRLPIHSLDRGIPAFDQMRDLQRAKSHEIGPDAFEQLTMQSHEQVPQSPEGVQLLDAWEQGNSEIWAQVRDAIAYGMIAPREDQWMKILTPKLKETSKPICIAVGVAHVVGYNSLPDRLRKEGFKVERVYSTPRSSL
jgi:uncharacterized protein YbaP (TraB family)